MHPSSVFIYTARDVPIETIVGLIFKSGYGILPFGNTHVLTDDHSPAILFGLRVYANAFTKAQELQNKISTLLTDNKIPYYSVIVATSENTMYFAWTRSNLIPNDAEPKKTNVSYLRLVKPHPSEEDTETPEPEPEENPK